MERPGHPRLGLPDRRGRAWSGLLAWYLVSNTVDNLQRQKIACGFHYLDREAGFEIGDTMIAYSPASTYARAILVGLLNTLKVSVLGVIMATILGTLIGVGRLRNNWLLARICAWYVEAFRNVPLLLWLFLFYKLISEAFPGPRQAIGPFWNSVFLSPTAASTSRCRSPTRSTNGWARPAGRHRRRLVAAPLGQEAPGRDRPALSQRSRRASAWRSACPSWSGCWAARRTT